MRLNCDAGAFEVELVGNAWGQRVLIVPGECLPGRWRSRRHSPGTIRTRWPQAFPTSSTSKAPASQFKRIVPPHSWQHTLRAKACSLANVTWLLPVAYL